MDRNVRILEVDRYLTGVGNLSGCVLIAEKGKVIYKKAFGYANRTQGSLNTTETSFSVASALGKPITATAVFQLIERNMLSLEEPIENFFPEYVDSRITVGHLLNHTSGIPNYLMMHKELKWENDYSKAQILGKVKEKRIRFSPGKKFAYNNTGFYLAGLIIEKITGKTYENYVTEYIFQPAGMNASGFEMSGKPMNLADGHINGKQVSRISPTLLFACGDVISTVEDMYKFDAALHNGTLLHKDTAQQMIEPTYRGSLVTVGYSWNIKHLFERGSICHAGTHPSGYVSHIERYLNDEMTIIVVSNDMVKHSRLGMKEFAGTFLSREIASIIYRRKLRFWQKVI